MYTVAIVGGGFSGTALAVQLLRRATSPLRVLLIERRAEVGWGVAYGTRSPEHLLNVPAGRMSLFPDEPQDFLRFAAERDAATASGSFVPRRLYAEYLGRRLEEAAAGSRATLERVTGEAMALESGDGRLGLRLADGRRLPADRLVLASGNQPPADPGSADAAFLESPAYVRDPWQRGALERLPRDRPVLLIGTGLTMVDTVLELRRLGHHGQMIALSRRGLLPRAHRPHADAALQPDTLVSLLREGPAEIRRYLRITRLCVAELGERGIDWREVLNSVRPFTAELWRGLDLRERRRFLRHLQPYWDVHRHRIAPAVADTLDRMLKDGRLHLEAGRLLSLEALPDGARVEWRARRRRGTLALQVGGVVNCTGPDARVRRSADPLLRDLLQHGRAAPDPLGIGIAADAAGAMLDGSGRASDRLFYVGPLLRARDWECTAVPELRVAAQRLAESLLAGAAEAASAEAGSLAPA